MATAEQVLAIARAELGYTENPRRSNQTKYGVWFGMNGQPWCMMFVQWCFDQAEAADLLPNTTTASCGTMMRAAQAVVGCWVTGNYRPGDVVIYDFDGDGTTDHTGIVESVTTSGVIAIEGNTGSGNDANGGQVQERPRNYDVIKGAIRPAYEEEEDIVTQEQFNAMMDTWLAQKATAAPSDSSAEARAWAEGNGILTGYSDGTKRYKAYCTREQMVILLNRLWKLIAM